MALILNIDTATGFASVCLSKDAVMIGIETSSEQKDHAAFIQPAIRRIMSRAGHALSALDAVAVSNGPGSYTGLRVGLATAKGLCYALDKPLILVSTLQVMAAAAISHCAEHHADMAQDLLYCPMIDARRMEVFTAVYDAKLNTVMAPAAMILDDQSVRVIVKQHRVVFTGNGAEKFRKIMNDANAMFSNVQHDASSMQSIAEQHYLLKSFADKAYSEPYYIKEFFSTASKLKSD